MQVSLAIDSRGNSAEPFSPAVAPSPGQGLVNLSALGGTELGTLLADPLTDLDNRLMWIAGDGNEPFHVLQDNIGQLVMERRDEDVAFQLDRVPLIGRLPTSGGRIVSFIDDDPMGATASTSQFSQGAVQAIAIARSFVFFDAIQADDAMFIRLFFIQS